MKRYATIIILLIIIIVQIFILRLFFSFEKKRCVLPERFLYEITENDYDALAYKNRRDRLYDVVSDGVIIISAKAGNDFKYITGFDERVGTAILQPKSETPFTLFVEPYNLFAAQWTGELYGIEGAIEKFGADKAFDIATLLEEIPGILKTTNKLFLHSNDKELKSEVEKLIKSSKRKIEVLDIDAIIHEMRVVKDEWEIAQIRQAVNVTALAHKRVWETVMTGQKEYEVQAEIEYVYRKNGLKVGFYSIIGSGPNATVLHHYKNNREIIQGDLLLVDIGAASKVGYNTDITRTIPVSGKFSKEQKIIYELVLKAFDEGVKEFMPGNKVLDPSHKAINVLVNGLYDLGLITDTTQWWQKRFYIQHRTSHYIGLNVHDVGLYGDFDINNRDEHILSPEFQGRELLPGMVLSMEPGLYFMENKLDHLKDLFGHLATEEELNDFAQKVRPIYEKYQGIGVRIEDVILVTQDGHENLSGHLPKKVYEIENWLKD
ncbi:MAG: aminopeptidase P N-terminal domain-containing protein [Bacteroidetes bacterium]|nr:aminopeptidase P N-terminal domain-containing protein [Bacteroidota bacterium]